MNDENVISWKILYLKRVKFLFFSLSIHFDENCTILLSSTSYNEVSKKTVKFSWLKCIHLNKQHQL